MKSIPKILFLVLFFSIQASVFAESKISIKTDVIKGNSELPKVLYIIPWQSTITDAKFTGVQLDNYFEHLLKPFHPLRNLSE